MTRPAHVLLEKLEHLRDDVRRRREARPNVSVMSPAEATHRDIALSNTTIQLAPNQVEAVRITQQAVTREHAQTP